MGLASFGIMGPGFRVQRYGLWVLGHGGVWVMGLGLGVHCRKPGSLGGLLSRGMASCGSRGHIGF